MQIKPYTLQEFNKHYEGHYSESALEWRRLGAVDKANNLERLLAGRQVDSVLEVGCGTGAVLANIAARGIGRKHTGVDLADPNMHADPRTLGLDLRAYDGARLPFEDCSFDLVYATHVVEHVPDPRGFLAELARVSRGLIYVEVPCELHARVTRRALQAALDTGHINAYSPEYFLVLLQTTGMEVVDLELFDHSLAVHCYGSSTFKARLRMLLRRWLLQINPILASRFFCYHCGALARPTAPR
jgi:SAM-dependent methyltransferase